MNVTEMVAGQALDILVAEKLMGWERHPNPIYHAWYQRDSAGELRYRNEIACGGCGANGHQAWSPSTSITDAWEVVEKLRADWALSLDNWPHVSEVGTGTIAIEDDGYEVRFRNRRKHFNENGAWVVSTGRAAPLAICKAALLAVGITDV